MKIKYTQFLGLLLCIMHIGTSNAQERWFKIELSIFTNESTADRLEEQWQADRMDLAYPDGLQRLNQLSDLLLTEDMILATNNSLEEDTSAALSPEEIQLQLRNEAIAAIGPDSATTGGGFRLFDFEREGFLQLPTSESDFQQTNRTLERSSEHRLLFHGLWRQAVRQENLSTPIYIEGGLAYGEQHELQGSLVIRFNENEDRVVIDTNLWLTEFSIVENQNYEWQLPPIPDNVKTGRVEQSTELRYYPIQIYQMQQNREMRSGEFHYLDHPSLGIVIEVEPFEVPPISLSDDSFQTDQF